MLVTASAAQWETHYDAALQQAAQQDKLVLADFTGSDWCYYCIRMRKDVFDKPSFAAWAGAHFVLLEVDMPENPDFDPALRKQNTRLCQKYGVDSYPTILVMDAAGEPLGGFFGYISDADDVQKELAKALRVKVLLQAARQKQGAEKTQLMLAAWNLIPEDIRECSPNIAAQVAAVDTQDVSGLRAAAEAERMLEECRAAAAAAPTDTAALQIVDAALARALPQNKRQLLELKYRLLVLCVETPEDVLAAAEVAYAVIDADLRLSPQAKESHKKQLRGVYANPQTIINRSRMILRKRPSR